jgi:competence protein ComEA
MLRSRSEAQTARDRLRALTPGWVPTATDVDEAVASARPAASDTQVPPGVGSPAGRHTLPGREQREWRLDASGLRALASLGLAAVAGGLVVVVLGWPRGEVAPPASEGMGATGQNALAEPTSPSVDGQDSVVVVDVDGRVRRPGVVELPGGSRVVDAIDASGGLARGADTGPLNLAKPLVDGEQVIVPARGDPASAPPGVVTPGSAPSMPTGADPGAGLVSINTATETELDTLPGIGPVLAAAIVEWRTQSGGFTSVEQLQEVSGIGPATYAELAPLVRL